MKKVIPFLIVTALVITAVLLLQGAPLQTQLLRDQSVNQEEENNLTPTNCQKMSEKQANECFQKIAIRDKNEAICEEISTTADKRKCQREVQLVP